MEGFSGSDWILPTISKAPGPATNATWLVDTGLFRNATPNPSASRIGNPKTQKITSGSRRISFMKKSSPAPVSERLRSHWGRRNLFSDCHSVLPQVAPGQANEHVLKACLARAQVFEHRR